MDKELKEKWLVALRSDKYKQGIHRLRTADNFCCLGVLCDITDPDGWEPDGWEPQDGEFDDVGNVYEWNDGDSRTSYFASAPWSLLNHTDQDHLMQMNDSGSSFSEIADYIEENL